MVETSDRPTAIIADVLAELEEIVVRYRAGGTRRSAGGTDRTPLDKAQSIYRARQARGSFFGANGDVFADPAWDILLDLFAARELGRRVSISSACIAANVPPTTALRWLGTLEERDLIERKADEQDRRRSYVQLTDQTYAALRDWMSAWA